MSAPDITPAHPNPLYELTLTVHVGGDRSRTVITRCPFPPSVGTKVTIRSDAPSVPSGYSMQAFRVLAVGIYIDEHDGTPDVPTVVIECDVEEVPV